jgi:hypothetical protein
MQLLLAVLFGPIGLFYSSVPAAVILSLVAVLLVRDTTGEAVLLAWPLSVATGFFTVRRWNRRAAERAQAHDPRERGDQPCTQLES